MNINQPGVTWSGSSAYQFEVTNANSGTAGTGGGWDLLTMTSLTITATPSDPYRILLTSLTNGTDQSAGAMNLANWNSATSYAWLFVQADPGNVISTFDPGAFAFDYTGFLNDRPGTFSVARGDQLDPSIGGDDTQLYIVYAAVPEPGTLVLAGVGIGTVAAGWASRRRRIRRHASA